MVWTSGESKGNHGKHHIAGKTGGGNITKKASKTAIGQCKEMNRA